MDVTCKIFECLSSQSTIAKVYPLAESDMTFLEKIRENMVGGASLVFTKKTVVEETCIQDSTNWCKAFVGIDACQLYSFSIRQAVPTGL